MQARRRPREVCGERRLEGRRAGYQSPRSATRFGDFREEAGVREVPEGVSFRSFFNPTWPQDTFGSTGFALQRRLD